MWSVSVILGWITFEVTNSPLLTALAIGVGAIPQIIAGPLAGVLTDSWDRKKLMSISLAMQGLTALIFGFVVSMNLESTWNIFAFAIINGIWGALYFPAANATVPNVVPRRNLVNAFSLVHFADSSTRLFIPATTGALISLVGPGLSLMLPAVCLLSGYVSCMQVEVPQMVARRIDLHSAYLDIVSATSYIGSNKAVMGFIVVLMAPLIFATPINIGLMPVYASQVFGGGPRELGFLVSTLGAGMTIGTLVLASVRDTQKLGFITMITMGGMAIGLFLFSKTNSISTALAVLFPYGSILIVFWTISSTAIQTIVPDRLRGRVTSLSMITSVSLPIGTLGVGLLSEMVGVQNATSISAVGLLVFMILSFVLLPEMSRYRTPDSATEPEVTEAVERQLPS